MSWLKWYHLGVPDEEGAERDNIREKLSLFYHCLTCTALSGCYFPVVNFPVSPVHPNCDCLLFDIDVSFNDISAICDIRKFTEYLFNYDKNNGKAYLLKVGDLMSVIRKHLKRFLRCKQKRNICPEILYCRKAIDMVSELQ